MSGASRRYNPHPLWGFSSSYRVPSGRMAFFSGVVRCATADIHAMVVEMIKRNPRRRYAGKLDIYSRSVIEENSRTHYSL